MANTDYGTLRDGLWDIQKEFEAGRYLGIPMHHDLFWSPEFEGWDESEYRAFIKANTQVEEFTGEAWELWPGRIACSRYFGMNVLFESRLAEFRHLSARAYRTLCSIAQLDMTQYQLVDIPLLDFPVTSEAVSSHPGDSAVHFGWLELLHDAGLYCPSTCLQSDNGWWKYSGSDDIDTITQHRTGSGTSTYPTHPAYQSVSADIFDASAEFIQMILEPDTVGFLHPASSPLCLKFSDGKVEQCKVSYRPTIHIPDEADIPQWDAGAGELWFQDQAILTLKGAAPNQRKILDAFDIQGWVEKIVNPFREPSIEDWVMDNTLRTTIEDMNKRLCLGSAMSFGRRDNGKHVIWSLS